MYVATRAAQQTGPEFETVVTVMVDRTKQALGPGPKAPAKFSLTLRPEWSWTLGWKPFHSKLSLMHVCTCVCVQ